MFAKISFAYSETLTGSDVSTSMSITSSSVDFSTYKLIHNHVFWWLKHGKEKRYPFFLSISISWSHQDSIKQIKHVHHIHFKHAPIQTLTRPSSSFCCCLESSWLLLLSASELQLKSSHMHISYFYSVDNKNGVIIECTWAARLKFWLNYKALTACKLPPRQISQAWYGRIAGIFLFCSIKIISWSAKRVTIKPSK